MSTKNTSPALHNAMWPGLVGKGPDSEPPISLETMLDLTCGVSVNGVKFDGVDLFLCLPHTDIDSSDDDLKKLAPLLANPEGPIFIDAKVNVDVIAPFIVEFTHKDEKKKK